MSGFWQQCLESFQPEALGGTLYRIVESQKIIATNQLVDDRHEQQLLEELLEKSKPRINQKLEKIATGLDYLLWTPFDTHLLNMARVFRRASNQAYFMQRGK